MVRDEFEFVKADNTSEKEISKLKLIADFYDKLPSIELKGELLSLMRRQPSMSPSEFESGLQDFSERAKAALSQDSVSAYLASKSVTRLH